MLASECATPSLPSNVGAAALRGAAAPVVMRFYLWLFPLASLACHAEPQHPGDRAQRRALPASEPRVLSHTESGELAGWGLGPSLPLLGHHCGALPFPSGRQAIVCCSSPLLAEALPWPLARPGLWLTLASGSVMWEWGGGCSFEPSVSSPWALPSF